MIIIIKKYYFSLILLLCLLPAVLPIFKPYVSGTADGLGHRFRLVSFYNSLSQGILRPRWAAEAALGYGAPTFLFNYPLPYYLASLFHAVGFGINQSGQLLSALSLLLSGLFMYLLVRKLTGRKTAGLVAAAVYVYAPYHLLMTYLYDAWGEITAFVFPPLILYFIICLIGQISLISQIRKALFFILLVFSWVLFILSHNVSAIMFAPILLILSPVILVSEVRAHPVSRWDSGQARMTLFFMVNSFVLAVLISAFFWLPAFIMQNEMKYPQFLAGESAMRGSFFKSFSSQVTVALNVVKEGTTRYMDFTIGLPILSVILISLIGLIRLIREPRKIPVLTVVFTVLLLLCLYFANYSSNWLWGLFYFRYILYPFRFLFPATFLGSIIAGLMTTYFLNHYYHATVCGNNAGKIIYAGIAGVVFMITISQGLPYTRPYIDIFPFDESYFRSRQTVSFAPWTRKNMLISEFLPISADTSFLKEEELKGDRQEFRITRGEGTVKNIRSGSEWLTGEIDAKNDVELTVNRFYFPNWQMVANGKEISISKDNFGRMKIYLSGGNYNFKLEFVTSRIEKIAYLISLVGLLFLAFEIIKSLLWKS